MEGTGGRKKKRKANNCEESCQRRACRDEESHDATDMKSSSTASTPKTEGKGVHSQSNMPVKKKVFKQTNLSGFVHVKKPSPSNPLQCHPDIQEYRNRYPNKEDDKYLDANWKFYKNEIKSSPRGDFIDVIHKHWYGNYSLLEEHHGYIQWLFPIREQGMNWKSQELQQHEAKKISESEEAKKRVIMSYRMMLDFWGMHLEDEKTGTIVRGANWEARFTHLNRSYHNYMRITRMLKSLGELGQDYLQTPFLKFILQEVLNKRTLINAKRSCLNFWIHTVLDDEKRESVLTLADDLYKKYKL